MARTTPATCPDCPRCRARAIGLGTGPYTVAELQQMALEPARPERDPEVVAAEHERDQARLVFDSLNSTWQRLIAEKTNAHLRGDLDTTDRRQLDEDEAQAREVRDRAWRPVVAANERLRLAQLAAQQREAHAA